MRVVIIVMMRPLICSVAWWKFGQLRSPRSPVCRVYAIKRCFHYSIQSVLVPFCLLMPLVQPQMGVWILPCGGGSDFVVGRYCSCWQPKAHSLEQYNTNIAHYLWPARLMQRFRTALPISLWGCSKKRKQMTLQWCYPSDLSSLAARCCMSLTFIALSPRWFHGACATPRFIVPATSCQFCGMKGYIWSLSGEEMVSLSSFFAVAVHYIPHLTTDDTAIKSHVLYGHW